MSSPITAIRPFVGTPAIATEGRGGSTDAITGLCSASHAIVSVKKVPFRNFNVYPAYQARATVGPRESTSNPFPREPVATVRGSVHVSPSGVVRYPTPDPVS